jgi:acetyltransferase-like isoleucine patch superfamily enzyme
LGANIGSKVNLGEIEVLLPERLTIEYNCDIQSGVRISSAGRWEDGEILIGKNTFVGYCTILNIGSSLKIGANCLIAANCMLTDAHHPFNGLLGPIRDEPAIHKPIVIEDDVWIGACAVVLQGVTIGAGSVIAANAVVNRDIPSNEIWGGVPARKISTRILRN